MTTTVNMEEVLAVLGTTPHVIDMVLASETMMTIYEEIDLHWKILTETSVKARSIRGYKSKNFMMTGNKFLPKEPKPELLEDWDPRIVVTNLTFDETGGEGKERLILDQVAEKDLLYAADSRVYIEGDGPDAVKQTYVVFVRGQKPIRGHKCFVRYNPALHVSAQQMALDGTRSPGRRGSKESKAPGANDTPNGGGLMVPMLGQGGRKLSCVF